jgi:hypothetical protein
MHGKKSGENGEKYCMDTHSAHSVVYIHPVIAVTFADSFQGAVSTVLLHAIVELQYLLLTNQIQNIDKIGDSNYLLEHPHSTGLDQTEQAFVEYQHAETLDLED